MQLNYRHAESDTCPDEIDKSSSPTTVYVRKNITRVEKENEDGSTHTAYEYDEAKLSRSDYAIYLAENNEAMVDYIAMMEGVDL